MSSLRLRLGIGLALSLLLVFALQWLAVTAALRQLAEAQISTRLQHDLDNLLAGLSVQADGRLALDPARVALIYNRPLSGHYFQITSGEQMMRSRSLWDTVLPVTLPPPGSVRRRRVEGPAGQPLLLQEGGYTIEDRPVALAVAEDLGPLAQQLQRFGLTYAMVSAGVLMLLVLVQALLVRLALKPIDRARAGIVRLERGEIDALSEQVPRELLPFVRELNRLLAVLRRRLERSRHALGNLAHALKGPLTLLAELAGRRELNALPEIRASLRTQNAALAQLVERELARARLAGPATGARFDAASELPALIDAVTAIYRDKALAVEPDLAPGLVVSADREDMLELLGNLLDNACKWARKRVRIRLVRSSGLLITVEDDGPGLAPETSARIAQRGVRLDEAMPGHGLGLAIVRDIVESYNGTLDFAPSETLGGLAVRVVLPAA